MAEELEDGSQSRARSGARHRGGGAVGLAADGARRREGGRPGRGRRDAAGAQQPVDRGHGRDRRGRARRGADALYRREGRHRAGPEDRHRARPARRHDDHRQGRRQRARGAGDGRCTAAFSTRPTSTWTRSRSAAACPTASSISTTTPAENLANLAQAKKVEVADLVVCILDRPRHAELIAKVREAGARIMLIGDGDVSGVIATSDPETGHRHLHGLGRRAGGRAGGGGAALHRRPDAGPAAVPQRRRARPRARGSASPTSTANTRCSTWPRAT